MTKKIHYHRKTREELEEWADPARPAPRGIYQNNLRFACRREFWPDEYRAGRYLLTNIHDEVTCEVCLKNIRREIQEEQFKRDLQEGLARAIAESGINLSDILPE